jgi:hypothetical protein
MYEALEMSAGRYLVRVIWGAETGMHLDVAQPKDSMQGSHPGLLYGISGTYNQVVIHYSIIKHSPHYQP